MKTFVLSLALLLLALAPAARAQVEWDVNYIEMIDGVPVDTFTFWAKIPVAYNPAQPPALLLWWHHWGSDYHEMRDTELDDIAMERNWIAATFGGPYERKHYNARAGQYHCRRLLDSLYQLFPFCRDSIYMIGASMGGAAGLVWNNNNSGVRDDYMAAATVGGSDILDCQLRQEQYLEDGGINVTFTVLFGGLPADCARVAFEYHRASAVFLADTTQSMHFNSLNLPAYHAWGSLDAEWRAYGHPSEAWVALRQVGRACSTVSFCSEIPSHGLPVLNQRDAIAWLSGFSLNRFPDTLSINADEGDEYYWTRVEVADTHAVFGRYGIAKNPAAKRIDFQLVRNIRSIDIECDFPWPAWDTLQGHWENLDVEHVNAVAVRLVGVPEVAGVERNAVAVPFAWANDTLSLQMAESGDYRVIFGESAAGERPSTRPATIRLAAAYPNPFNSQLTLEIESPLAGTQEIRIYDVTGRVAKTLTAELRPGLQQVSLSAADLASGIYFVQLAGSAGQPVKIVLLR